jgi:hypothetical protein
MEWELIEARGRGGGGRQPVKLREEEVELSLRHQKSTVGVVQTESKVDTLTRDALTRQLSKFDRYSTILD